MCHLQTGCNEHYTDAVADADAQARHRKPDLAPLARRVADGEARLGAARLAHWRALQARLASLHGVLEAVSPQATLKRGYAIVEHEGRLVSSATQAPAGARIEVRMHDGSFGARVDTVEQARAPGADKPR